MRRINRGGSKKKMWDENSRDYGKCGEKFKMVGLANHFKLGRHIMCAQVAHTSSEYIFIQVQPNYQ